MNFLVHLYLSDPEDECRLGNLMGDYVKGRLTAAYPPGLRHGLWQHRRIDALAQTSLSCRRSRARIDPRFGHCRSILVDIFYDHLLAGNWAEFSPQPLEDFTAEICDLLRRNLHRLPPGLKEIAPRMVRDSWLLGYRDLKIIGRVLERVAQRLPRANPLAEGLPELLRELPGLAADCSEFLREAKLCLQSAQARENARTIE